MLYSLRYRKLVLFKYVWISCRRMNAGNMLKIESNDVTFYVTNRRWHALVPTASGLQLHHKALQSYQATCSAMPMLSTSK
jgi:hypothetical protein